MIHRPCGSQVSKSWITVDNSGLFTEYPHPQQVLSPVPEVIHRVGGKLCTCCARLGIERHQLVTLTPIYRADPTFYTGVSTRLIHICGCSWGLLGQIVIGVTCESSGRESDRSGLGLNPAGEVGDLVIQATALRHQFTNLSVGVHHGGVVTSTECLTNLG